MHHALVNIIEPIWEPRFIYDTYANRVGKGTHAALDRCQQLARRFKYVLQCDLRQCHNENMNLPNLERAVIPRAKIVNYLLSFTHRDGHSFATRSGKSDARRTFAVWYALCD